MAYEKLAPYRRSIRPVQPESFPRYVEQELDRLGGLTNTLLQAVKDLDARITALETP